jgi:polar amino acid transport system substrate-binding protein
MMRATTKLWTVAAAALTGAASPSVSAAPDSIDCGVTYEVATGDTLSAIASAAYDDYRKWTLIYNANSDVIGDDPGTLETGTSFRIPCLQASGSKRSLQAAEGKAVKLLSGGNYRPFTHRDRDDGGLISDLLNAALDREAAGFDSYGFAWENDWSKHLEPLLAEGTYDVGYPWLKPDCRSNRDHFRCKNFLFSEPLFEMLVVLFVAKDNPIEFERDSDVIAKVLCRPKGYYTHDLEKNGRNWLSHKKITLRQPDSIDACFKMLTDRGVDAVALNEFTGRSAMHRLDLADEVKIVKTRPLSVEGLHVVVHRDHPRAGELIDGIDRAIGALKDSGRYDEIVDRHLSAYWEQF